MTATGYLTSCCRLLVSEHTTGAAVSAAVAVKVRVLRGELMTPHAMSLSGVQCRRSDASSDILFRRNGLKVVRVDASRSPAQMVKGQSLWDWGFEQFIRESMGEDTPFPVEHAAVSRDVEFALPQPAVIGAFHIMPESFCGCHTPSGRFRRKICCAVSVGSHVVVAAKSFGVGNRVAAVDRTLPRDGSSESPLSPVFPAQATGAVRRLASRYRARTHVRYCSPKGQRVR